VERCEPDTVGRGGETNQFTRYRDPARNEIRDRVEPCKLRRIVLTGPDVQCRRGRSNGQQNAKAKSDRPTLSDHCFSVSIVL
jgi:hypothetical protein